MKKKTLITVIIGTLLLCAATCAAGRYAREKLIDEAVQEMQNKTDSSCRCNDCPACKYEAEKGAQ